MNVQGGFLQYDTPDQIQAYTLQAPYAGLPVLPNIGVSLSTTVGDAAMRALTTDPSALSAFADACVASSVRVVGSGHSFYRAIATQGTLLSLSSAAFEWVAAPCAATAGSGLRLTQRRLRQSKRSALSFPRTSSQSTGPLCVSNRTCRSL